MHKVEELKVWQRSIELAKAVYQVISELPNDETYGLSRQIKRSAVSIASNIAEGADRNTNKEFNHFLGIANGSSYELQTQLLLTKELSLIKKEKVQPIIELCIEIQKMIYVFQKKI